MHGVLFATMNTAITIKKDTATRAVAVVKKKKNKIGNNQVHAQIRR
jgi:hypothetical protein